MWESMYVLLIIAGLFYLKAVYVKMLYNRTLLGRERCLQRALNIMLLASIWHSLVKRIEIVIAFVVSVAVSVYLEGPR